MSSSNNIAQLYIGSVEHQSDYMHVQGEKDLVTEVISEHSCKNGQDNFSVPPQ